MGVSINWLKDYVNFTWTSQEVAHRLTMAGIAIDGVEKRADDSILELDLTPNRGDCLGVINLAREIAALNGTDISIPKIEMQENQEDVHDYISVEIADPDLCPRYTARMVKNIKIKPSPEWLQNKLLSCGINPINNIVDVTNFVMMESNQPLHAFDYDLLGEAKKIVVRRAMAGEKITTLDDVERELEADMLLITDNGRPVAIAGTMGGQNTEITDHTVNVLLESACFKGTSIRKTSKKLALRSDSSIRFEKGSDINGLIYAVNRAAALMQELGEGEVVAGICDCYPDPQPLPQVVLRPERVNYLLGISLSPAQITDYIEKLKFKWHEEEGNLLVTIPSYRPDIEMEVDLIEEVARLHGYEQIPATLPCGDTTQGGLTAYQKFKDRLKQLMTGTCYEIINYSFITPRYFDMLLLPSESNLRNIVRVANPLSEEQSVMRTLLLPGILDTVSRNLARKNSNLAFFEMGSVFYPQGEGLPVETLKLGAVVAGKLEMNWLKQEIDMDFYYLKGVLENLLCSLGIDHLMWVEANDQCYHPGRSAIVKSNDKILGIIGEIHPLVRQNFDIKPRACAFELDVDTLYELSHQRVMMEQITRYPAVERDLAIVVDEQVKAFDAIEVIRERGGELLQNTVVFDIYSGEQVPKGCKSMAIKMTFQSSERTLTESEVNTRIDEIMMGLKAKIQASLR
ncbi:MAG: phenylalanine--tRNA ligase subunit beta [Firmicutes bacterium HGW-Firmicutes-15]|nr:MAG: phenylalanine--tRNA ligase subunit beta [Firmicutes bacterium HGW-Firmicutes-15]